MASAEKILTRPKKNLTGGFGNYCCVPGCASAFYDNNREKTGITLFCVPKREPLRKKWLNVLKNIRRKGTSDTFDTTDPNKRIFVCEFHFKDDDLRFTWGTGKKKVKAGSIPSIFKPQEPKKTRHTPAQKTTPHYRV